MKLTKHQKEIVKKIDEGEVYDIPSYLKIFMKFEIAKYDMNALEEKFNIADKNIEYRVLKNSKSFYERLNLITQSKSNQISDEDKYNFEWEYHKPVFNRCSELKEVKYNETQFNYDFVNDGVFVKKNFNDIKDFITLWSYLKRESLILEVDKKPTEDDISIFFEKKEKKKAIINKNIQPFIKPYTQNDILFGPVSISYKEYLDFDWYINEEHKLICNDFIDKKILPNSDLKIYINDNFRTKAELSQFHSLFVAWIAVAISVISIVLGNIVPLLKNDNKNIEKKLNSIESDLGQISSNLHSNYNLSDISEILKEIKAIKEQLNTQK